MNKKGIGMIGIAVMTLILFIVGGVIIKGIPLEENTGSQSGYITTIETNGIIFKTDSIYIKSNLESSQEERYCLEGKENKEILTKAMEEGSKVKIYFNDIFWRAIDRCKSYDLDIIYKVEVINENEK